MASEAVELTRHGGGSTKLTWATIDKGVKVGCLDQVEQRQVRLQRQKRKERDATASGTPGVKRIVTDVLAQLGDATEPVVQRRVVTAVQVKGKEPVIEEAVQEELWEEEELVPQHLTKAQRKLRNLAQGGQGSGKAQAPQALAATPLNVAGPSSSTGPSQGGAPSYGQWPWTIKATKAGLEKGDEAGMAADEEGNGMVKAGETKARGMKTRGIKARGIKVRDIKARGTKARGIKARGIREVRAPGRPGVNVVGSSPQSGVIGRPLTPQAWLAQAARTRSQAKANASQEPPRREPEPEKRKEAVEVEDDDDEEEEDERLRREEDQRAEQRARKKGTREEAELVIRDGLPKKKKYAVRLKEGFDVERMIDRLLEGHNDLMILKEILASAPRLRDELKGRLSRRLVPNVHLGTILPKKAEWPESGTKMDWKCVTSGTVDLVVKGSKCAPMVDTGAEMNIIREADAIRFGLDIYRSDCGILHRASCKAIFCGTTSNVLIEVGKVKTQAYFFIMPDVDHRILLGRSFLSRMKTAMFNKHEGTLILLLCDPACGNYKIITCRNTGPRSIRNRPNPGSFTIEESEGERRRLRAEPEAGERVKAFSLSLPDVGKAMDLVAAHEMTDPDAIQALREQILECPEAGRLKLEGEAVENTPPVDGFLDQEEAVRLHINKWSPRVPSCVGYPIWQASSGYEQRAELVLKPFEEEDPWGGKGVQWIMELALARSHSLVEDLRTIEEGPGQVERHEDMMGGMYLLTNTLLQESLDQSGLLNPAGNVDEVPESQDDEFEEGEIKEVFRAEESDGIYLELGLLLSCKMRLRDASDRAQRMLQRYLVRDGHLFVRREVGNPRRVVCGRKRQIDVIAALHGGIAGGHRGVQATSDFTKTAMSRGGKGTRPPRRPLGASGGYERHGPRHRESTPEYDGDDIELFLDSFWEHARRMGWTVTQGIERLRGVGRFEEPVARIRREAMTRSEVELRIVERRQRRQRQRDPEPREARPFRGGRKTLVRKEEEPEPEPEAEERGAYPECGLRPMEFHRFTEGGLRRSPARTREEPPAIEEPLRELEAHLDVSRWRASPRGEEHGEQAEEVPREEVPREEVPRKEMPREEVRDTQRERGLGDEGRHAGKEVIEVEEDTPP
ncbi:hypothetical protein CBR_g18741 [Chara braunii]|uniref:Peptidase A2 domain-containing protein n=1 Tax=Chara braunii TaxID=69332 RepID=A0A388KW89_CHABU|nr:hypothetical protein CBR_g18741 [Chara braunii]|eukprot:GBG74330.1 hypothetical protein CBR_g18741 [Chara braunii]